MKLINTITERDFFKLSEDYTKLQLRLNKYISNGWNKTPIRNIPIETYKLAIKDIEEYLTYIDKQINDIDEDIKRIKDETLASGLIISKKRLDMLKWEFILLWNKLEKLLNKNSIYLNKDNKIKNINKYKIKSAESLLEYHKKIIFFKDNLKEYKALQKELNIKLDLDDKLEKSIEQDLNFLDIETKFFKKYIDIMKNYKILLLSIKDFANKENLIINKHKRY